MYCLWIYTFMRYGGGIIYIYCWRGFQLLVFLLLTDQYFIAVYSTATEEMNGVQCWWWTWLVNFFYQANLPYHTSAILAASLDNMTLPYRLLSCSSHMRQMTASLTPLGRKVGLYIYIFHAIKKMKLVNYTATVRSRYLFLRQYTSNQHVECGGIEKTYVGQQVLILHSYIAIHSFESRAIQ